MITNGEKQFWSRLGEEVCAPLYFSLCHWIRESIRREGISRLLFLARDGHILGRAWDCLFPTEEVSTDYLWVSRRCLRVAAMERLGPEEWAFLNSGKYLAGGQRWRQLGWDYPDGLPLDPDAPLSPENGELAAYILEKARAEREDYIAYLDSLDLVMSEQRTVALFDLGWHGSLQSSLEKLLAAAGSRARLRGFYMGTVEPLATLDGSLAEGLYFNRSIPERHYRTARHSLGLVEALFSAPHPSVQCVTREDDRFVPRYVADMEDQEFSQGIRLMQETALQILESVPDPWARDPQRLREEAFRRLERLLRNPSAEECRILGSLPHFGGFGTAPSRQCLAEPTGPSWNLVRLRNQYREADWRRGFLERLHPWQRLLLQPFILGMRVDRFH